MSFLNKNLQKENNQLNIKVNMNNSAFQKIFDKISSEDLYKKEFFYQVFIITYIIYKELCFFHKLLHRMKE